MPWDTHLKEATERVDILKNASCHKVTTGLIGSDAVTVLYPRL